MFIEESGHFGPISAWSVSRRMAMFRIYDETSLNRVKETQIGRGFEKIDASRDALETGFKTGDTSPIFSGRKSRAEI